MSAGSGEFAMHSTRSSVKSMTGGVGVFGGHVGYDSGISSGPYWWLSVGMCCGWKMVFSGGCPSVIAWSISSWFGEGGSISLCAVRRNLDWSVSVRFRIG